MEITNNDVKVLGRVVSIATDNIVADASQVHDSVSNQSLEQTNEQFMQTCEDISQDQLNVKQRLNTIEAAIEIVKDGNNNTTVNINADHFINLNQKAFIDGDSTIDGDLIVTGDTVATGDVVLFSNIVPKEGHTDCQIGTDLLPFKKAYVEDIISTSWLQTKGAVNLNNNIETYYDPRSSSFKPEILQAITLYLAEYDNTTPRPTTVPVIETVELVDLVKIIKYLYEQIQSIASHVGMIIPIYSQVDPRS